MANPHQNSALGQLRKLLAAERDSQLQDEQLLERFLAERDEAAFAALTKRHGPMVLCVCQSVLRHIQDAEDACRAAFLVLAKNASSIRKKTSVASWLHGVALRLARKLEASRKRLPEPLAGERSAANLTDELSWREVREIVHEELDRLPEKYRQPLILCYLEGRTKEQAARQLGWTSGTLKGMLTRGRDVLRQRLTRRGLALTVPLFAGALAPGTASAGWAKSTAHAAVLLVSGKTLGEGVSAQAVALAKGGINVMVMTKLKMVAALVLTLGFMAAGGGLAAYRAGEGEQAAAVNNYKEKAPTVLKLRQPAQAKEQPRVDLLGDLLPSGAIARIGTLRLFRTGTKPHVPGTPIAHLESYLAYTADGKRLICSDFNRAITVWDTATGKEVQRIAPRYPELWRFAVAPDGKTLVTWGRENATVLSLWDLSTGKLFRQLPVPARPGGFSFSPDGKILAGIADGFIRLWDTSNWEETTKSKCESGFDLFFLADRTLIVSGANVIRWQEAKSGNEIRRVDLGKKRITAGPAISAAGKTIAAVLDNSVLQIWDATTGAELSRKMVNTPVDEITAISQLCVSPDGQTLAWAPESWDMPHIVFFTADTARELRRWPQDGNLQAMAFSPDGKTLAQLTYDNAILLFDVASGKPALELPRPPSVVASVAFTPDGKELIVGCRGGFTANWDPMTGKRITQEHGPPSTYPGPGGFNIAVAFSSDRQKAALVDAGGVLHVWAPATGIECCRIAEPKVEQDQAVLSPDGKVVAIRHEDGFLRLWDAANGRELQRTLPMESVGWFVPEAFSPNGQIVAMGSKYISFWDVAQGKEIRRLSWPDVGFATSIAFTSDSKWLVSAHDAFGNNAKDEDKCLRLWEVATGHELRRFYAGGLAFWSIAISRDGKTVAGFGHDNSIYVWETASGQERGRFVGHFLTDGSFNSVSSLAISPDCRMLASGSTDRTALVWDLTGFCPDGKLRARELSGEELTRLWTDLAGSDGVKAYRAMWTMVAGGRKAVPFLVDRLRPIAPADKQRVARLIADLDNEQFKVRNQATAELQQLGELAEPALRKALEGTPTPETRQRLILLLDRLRNLPQSSEQLRGLRALEVLENLATLEARQLLQGLAKGASGAMQTKEAKAALERLAKRR